MILRARSSRFLELVERVETVLRDFRKLKTIEGNESKLVLLSFFDQWNIILVIIYRGR